MPYPGLTPETSTDQEWVPLFVDNLSLSLPSSLYVFSNLLPLSVDGLRKGPPSVSPRTSDHPELVRPVLSEAEGSEAEGSHATDRRTDLLFLAFDGGNDKIPR